MLIKKCENYKIIKNQGGFIKDVCQKEMWQPNLSRSEKYLKSMKNKK